MATIIDRTQALWIHERCLRYFAGSSGSRQNNELDHLTSFKAMEANYQPDGGEEEVEWYEDESEGEDDSRFVNFSLLSHIAVRLRDSLGVCT